MSIFGNSQLDQGDIRYDTHSFSAERHVYSLCAEIIDCANYVTLEGPPSYVAPNPNYVGQHPHNAAQLNGWNYLSVIWQHLAQITEMQLPIHHYLMVDDFNNVDPNYRNTLIQQFWSNVNIPRSDYFVYESDIATATQSDSCAVMDSYFQTQKFTQGNLSHINYLLNANIPLEQICHPIHVVVHPMSFQQQQRDMLRNLRQSLSSYPLFSQIPATDGRLSHFIAQSYRHVWLDESSGNIASITRPTYRSKKFYHQPIL